MMIIEHLGFSSSQVFRCVQARGWHKLGFAPAWYQRAMEAMGPKDVGIWRNLGESTEVDGQISTRNLLREELNGDYIGIQSKSQAFCRVSHVRYHESWAGW